MKRILPLFLMVGLATVGCQSEREVESGGSADVEAAAPLPETATPDTLPQSGAAP